MTTRSTLLAAVALGACITGCNKEDIDLKGFNTPPAVTITSPEDGTTAQEGTTITFVALTDDFGSPSSLSVTWSSDLDGVLLDDPDGGVDSDWNAQFSTASLSPGFHAVTLVVTDVEGATGQDSVNVRVTEVSDAPDLIIERPGGGETGTEGVPYSFQVVANDRQDPPQDLLVQLDSDQDGYVCNLPVDSSGEGRCIETLSLGTHLLTFTATDTDGFVTERTTYFDVLENLDVDDDTDGWTIAEGDCDDTDAGVNPDAPEEPYDGIDNDCNAGDLTDVDGDGYDADHVGGTDCDDADVQVNPGQPEILYDGIDNDCNGLTSDDDGDGDGWSVDEDCNDSDPLAWPGAVEVPYDGSDNDCDPATPDDDLDGDGYPSTITGGTDCDDGSALAHPGASEVLYDGLDNDCDPLTLDDDLDGDGYDSTVSGGGDCDDNNAAVNPTAVEVPYDGLDNDCADGDECDVDNDGLDSTAPLCGGMDCDDNNFAIGCTSYFEDIDGDGWGTTEVCACGPAASFTAIQGGDCYDFNADAHPGQSQFFTSDRGDGSYDYNCASGEEPLDSRTAVWDCDVDYVPILDVILDIDFDAGWHPSVPACGQISDWASSYNVVTTGFDADCDPRSLTSVQQACR